ncbi:M30 family zinc metallopeptidase [Cupriavidus campinensis]
MNRHLMLACLAASAITLAACGGGEDDPPDGRTAAGSPAASATPATSPSPSGATPRSAPDAYWQPRPTNTWTDVLLPGLLGIGLTPACDDCGAVSANLYAPEKGVGVWKYANVNGLPIDVPVILQGLTGQDVTLVFTNATHQWKEMAPITLSPAPRPQRSASIMHAGAQPAPAGHGHDATTRYIEEFNRHGWIDVAAKASAMAPSASRNEERRMRANDRKSWMHMQNGRFDATLVRQFATSDHTVVNIWVEDGQRGPGRITDEMVEQLGQRFAAPGKIYDLLKHVGGPLWGSHLLSLAMVGPDAPLDVVIHDIGGGLAGYTFTGDLFGMQGLNAYSNNSLAVHLNAASIYGRGENGVAEAVSTLAHEALHLQNFYRRVLRNGPGHMFAAWLEEMTAIMMEDYAAHLINPGTNTVRDTLFNPYITRGEGMYNCGLQEWDMESFECHSYAVAGPFGAFLLRQLGMDFFRDLLHGTYPGDSTAMLDQAIRTSTGGAAGLDEMFRRFNATTAGFMKTANAPSGYGFPERVEQGYTLMPFDPHAYAASRNHVTKVPAQLAPLASLPIIRHNVEGYFWESVKVPQGTVLSVVVQ